MTEREFKAKDIPGFGQMQGAEDWDGRTSCELGDAGGLDTSAEPSSIVVGTDYQRRAFSL